MSATPRIGTLREKPLHASLKLWYARPGDQVETPVDGYVIDIVRGDLLIEIQTGGFSSLKRKLETLLSNGHRIRIVYPVAADRWIVRLDEDGTILGRRLSPKHASLHDVFAELVYLVGVLDLAAIELDILITQQDEYRLHTPGRSWRRKGWSVVERRLVEIVESVEIRGVGDLAALLPSGLPDPFTTADLAARLGRPRRLCQQMVYCLRTIGAIEPSGKSGNSVEYRMNAELQGS